MYKVYFADRSIAVVPLQWQENPCSEDVYYKVQPGDDLSQLPYWFEKADDITSLVVEAGDPAEAFA